MKTTKHDFAPQLYHFYFFLFVNRIIGLPIISCISNQTSLKRTKSMLSTSFKHWKRQKRFLNQHFTCMTGPPFFTIGLPDYLSNFEYSINPTHSNEHKLFYKIPSVIQNNKRVSQSTTYLHQIFTFSKSDYQISYLVLNIQPNILTNQNLLYKVAFIHQKRQESLSIHNSPASNIHLAKIGLSDYLSISKYPTKHIWINKNYSIISIQTSKTTREFLNLHLTCITGQPCHNRIIGTLAFHEYSIQHHSIAWKPCHPTPSNIENDKIVLTLLTLLVNIVKIGLSGYLSLLVYSIQYHSTEQKLSYKDPPEI